MIHIKQNAALIKVYLLTWARAPVLNNRAVDGITTHTSQTGNHCSTRPQSLACDPIPNIGTCLRHGSPMMWTPYNQSNPPRDMVSAGLRRSSDSISGNLKLLSHNVGWGQPGHHNASCYCTHLCVPVYLLVASLLHVVGVPHNPETETDLSFVIFRVKNVLSMNIS